MKGTGSFLSSCGEGVGVGVGGDTNDLKQSHHADLAEHGRDVFVPSVTFSFFAFVI